MHSSTVWQHLLQLLHVDIYMSKLKYHKVVFVNHPNQYNLTAWEQNRCEMTHMYSIKVSLISTLYSTSRCTSDTLQQKQYHIVKFCNNSS